MPVLLCLLGEGGGEAGEAFFEGEAGAAEVESDEAWGTEVCAVVEGEAVGFEVSGWVFEAEGADIEPCEVGGFDVGHADERAAFGEEGGEAVAIAAEVAGEGEAPWFAVVVGGGGGGEAERVGFGDEGVFGGLEAAAEGGVGDDGEGEAESGDVVGFASGHEDDETSVEGVRESEGGGVWGGVGFEEEVAVDFVRAEEEIVAFAEGGDAFEFRAGPDPADWVVRAAEDEEPCARRDGAFHGVEVERVAAGVVDGERDGDEFAAGVAVGFEEWWVDGRAGHDGVAGVAGDGGAEGECGDHAGEPCEP